LTAGRSLLGSTFSRLRARKIATNHWKAAVQAGLSVSVRDKTKIPVNFLRQELGTDIIVLGFRVDKTWQNDLVYSVLDNFLAGGSLR
jgi:hypothetical protein